MTKSRTYTEAKRSFGDMMRQVTRGHRIRLTEHGKERAAVIPIEDLELLESLEDMVDLQEALRRMAENNAVTPARDVFDNLGV